jgi:hypothetical protein
MAMTDWFYLPEQSLAEAVNGTIFFDGLGEVTAIRQRLAYLPEDVRRKKLAGRMLLMGQSGQYNFGRCLARGERGAARMALYEFVKSAQHAAFLLEKHYMPYYKWSFRALRELPRLGELSVLLEALLCGPEEGAGETVEKVCTRLFEEARRQGLSDYAGSEAEGHA